MSHLDRCALTTCRQAASSVCGGCRAVSYCSRAHQVADWKQGHKQGCKKFKSQSSIPNSNKKTAQMEPLPLQKQLHHQHKRVVICGAGVIGVCIAYYLTLHGIRPMLLEQVAPACAGPFLILLISFSPDFLTLPTWLIWLLWDYSKLPSHSSTKYKGYVCFPAFLLRACHL